MVGEEVVALWQWDEEKLKTDAVSRRTVVCPLPKWFGRGRLLPRPGGGRWWPLLRSARACVSERGHTFTELVKEFRRAVLLCGRDA